MPQPTSNEIREARRKRLEDVLADLAAKGLTQAQIAKRLCVPAAYLSDVKNGYRTLSELFARRFADEFDVANEWLLHGTGTGERIKATPPGGAGSPMLLPVLTAPCLGDPRISAAADGSLVEISGPAAVAAAQAQSPYLMRLGVNVHTLGLRKDDLLLMSQRDEGPEHKLVVLQHEEGGAAPEQSLLLARRMSKGRYVRAASGRGLRGSSSVVGCCVGVVWRDT